MLCVATLVYFSRGDTARLPTLDGQMCMNRLDACSMNGNVVCALES